MSKQKVQRGAAATVVSYPAFIDDQVYVERVTAVTYRLMTPSTPYPTDETTWATGAYDTVSVGISAAADEGATSISLSSAATVVRNRKYLLDCGDGDQLVVIPRRSTVGTTVYLKEPLPRSIISGSQLFGLAVLVSLSAADTTLVGTGIVQWRASVARQTDRTWSSTFEIVRRICEVPLTDPELRQAYPIAERLQPKKDVDLMDSIEAAWEYLLLPRLKNRGVSEADILDSDVLKPLLALGTVLQLMRSDEGADLEFMKMLQDNFERDLGALTSRKDWLEASQEEINPVPAPSAENIRSVRLSR